MRTTLQKVACLVVLVAGLLVSGSARSQEPSKPGEPATKKASDEPQKPATAAKPAPTDEPSQRSSSSGEPSKGSDEPGKSSGEPGTKAPDEPGGDRKGEPGHGKGEPEAPKSPVVKEKKEKPVTSKFGIGVHIRAIFIHPWLMGIVFKESTALNSTAFGLEAVYRRGNFDIVGSVDFGLYSFANGNYLERGKNAADDTDYVQFDGFNILHFGVHFIKHEPITDWLSVVWGGGVGFGVVFGDIYRVSTAGCDPGNAGNEQVCTPLTSSGWDPNNPELWLNDPKNQGTKDTDTPQNPKRFREDRIWPVIPMVHLLVGLNFKITEQFDVRVDGGFRNAFYVGATGHYFF